MADFANGLQEQTKASGAWVQLRHCAHARRAAPVCSAR